VQFNDGGTALGGTAGFTFDKTSNAVAVTGNVQATTFKGTNFQATGSGGGALKNQSGTTQASWGGGGGDNFAVSVSTNLNGANAQIDISPTGTGHVHIKPTGTGAVEIAPTNPGSVNNMIIGNATPLAANFTTVGVSGNLQIGGYIYNSASTNKVITANGNANISTSVVKFGTGSFQSDGAVGTYLSTPVTNDFLMGTGDFTVEMFWYPTSVGSQTQVLFDLGVAGSAFDYRPQLYSVNGNVIYSGYNYTDDITGTTPVTANSWNHIAVAKSTGNTKLFLNGTQIGNTFVDSYSYLDGTGGQVRVGTTSYDNLSVSVSGYIDEVRVLQGEAAYTANFTPPAGPFIANANTVLLLHCDGTNGSTTFLDASSETQLTIDDNLTVIGDITTSGYFIGDGSLLTGITSSSSNSFSTIAANGTNIVADSSSDTLTFTAGTGISITGNATSDTITIAATGSGGNATPGGSDTHIQFNDGGVFAGNAQMTFSKTTGNVAFGNLIIQTTNPNNAAVITNTNTLDASARPLLERIVIGSGFDGDFGNTGDYLNTTRNSAVTVMNRWNQSSTSNSIPMVGQSTATWFNNTSGGNITSAGNARGMVIDTFYTGSRWGAVGTTTLPYRGVNINTLAGNGVSGGSVGTLVGMAVNAGTNSNNASVGDSISIMSNQSAIISGGNNGNVYGLTFNMNSSNPTVGNVYLLHNQANGAGTHNSTWGMGGNFRSASRYFFIRNDDDAAQVKLGSLRTYHENQSNVTSSGGAVTFNKTNSQVQRITLTENVTSVTFSNFVTTASDGVNTDLQADTMTLIVRNGATPYNITFPTGTGYKYAGGTNTTEATANSVQMVAVTAYYNPDTAAAEYLITVSPAFVQV
jgi:hypothetical protein